MLGMGQTQVGAVGKGPPKGRRLKVLRARTHARTHTCTHARTLFFVSTDFFKERCIPYSADGNEMIDQQDMWISMQMLVFSCVYCVHMYSYGK